MAGTFNVTDAYWQVTSQTTVVWSSARFMYVPIANIQYQSFLLQGGNLIQISDTTSLTGIMINQVIPNYLSGIGLAITSASNPAINSTYGLDSITIDQIGDVARDSACGLGLPLGLATFTYPDMNGSPVSFTGPQLQSLYKAMRDFTAGFNLAVAALVHNQTAALPSQPVEIG